MRRRHFLLGVGAVGTAGALGVASTLVGNVKVRWWVTDRAAVYPGLRDRVEEYLQQAFDSLRLSVDLSFGGVTAFATENAYRLVVDGVWPRRLLSGRGIRPVDGVNLLVTDGSIFQSPTGAGIPYVAAIGGASELPQAPPVEESGSVVPNAVSMQAMQILLHECGHALGLRHNHGTIRTDESAAVVSPMVSGYAWASPAVKRAQFDFEKNRCGDPYPDSIGGKRHRLLLAFDDCERQGLHRFRRSGLPTPPPASLSAEELLDYARSRCPHCSV